MLYQIMGYVYLSRCYQSDCVT